MLTEITIEQKGYRVDTCPEKYLVGVFFLNEQPVAVLAAHPDEKAYFSLPENRSDAVVKAALEQHPLLQGREYSQVTWLITFWLKALSNFQNDVHAISSCYSEDEYDRWVKEDFKKSLCRVWWPYGMKKNPAWSRKPLPWYQNIFKALEAEAALQGYSVPTFAFLRKRYNEAYDAWLATNPELAR